MDYSYNIEDKFEEYIQWYPNCLQEMDLLLRVCDKWATWLEDIPSESEKELDDFITQLDKTETRCFKKGMKEGSPLIPISIDFDCIISKEKEPKVYKTMEQEANVYFS